jgi:hypothetical protein
MVNIIWPEVRLADNLKGKVNILKKKEKSWIIIINKPMIIVISFGINLFIKLILYFLIHSRKIPKIIILLSR